MITVQIETTKNQETKPTLQNRLLTPIGESLYKGNTVSYQDFYTRSLPTNDKFSIDFCSELTALLAHETKQHAGEQFIIFSHRGSNVRRGCWNFTKERSGYPVGDYNSITPWWIKYFAQKDEVFNHHSNLAIIQKILTHSPTTEIDLRLEFGLNNKKDRFDYKTNRQYFSDFAVNIVPQLIKQLIIDSQLELSVDDKYFIKGVPPFAEINNGYSTYIGYIFHFYEPETKKPIFTFDFGTGNFWRNTLYEGHNVGEPVLNVNAEGLTLAIEKQTDNSTFVNPFQRRFSGSLYTASHGLNGYDIVTCGTRQAYIGAFHDPSPKAYIDPDLTKVARKLKLKYKNINKFRIPEITVNTIVALMADPVYTFDSYSLTDNFRQFKNLEFLADRPFKQAQLRKAIEKRMTHEYFTEGIWNPFLIVDALNEIGMNIKRDFSGLTEVLTS